MQHTPGFDDMAAKARIGRPPKPQEEHAVLLSTRWPRAIIERVDAHAEARPDQPVRAQVMREAMAIGLDELERRMAKGRK